MNEDFPKPFSPEFSIEPIDEQPKQDVDSIPGEPEVGEETKQQLLEQAEKSLADAKRAAELRLELKGDAAEVLTDEEKESLKAEIKELANNVYQKRRMTLGDDMFLVGHGFSEKEDEQGNPIAYPKVDGEVGRYFDAHGIAKTGQLDNLIALLEKGIDQDRGFSTAPFEVPNELKSLLGPALGTGGGTAYKNGIGVLTSGYKERLSENGIKHVFINDVYADLKGPVQQLFPGVQVHLLSEQKAVMEGEAKLLDKPNLEE